MIVSAPKRLRNSRVEFRKALDVGLVKDGIGPRPPFLRPYFAFPVIVLIHDDAFGNERRTVAIIERCVIRGFHLITEDSWIPDQLAGVGPRVGIKEKLVGTKPVALVSFVAAVNAIAIKLSRTDIGEVAVKDLVCVFGQCDARGFLSRRIIQQADFNLVGIG